jgi:hypothetical protein
MEAREKRSNASNAPTPNFQETGNVQRTKKLLFVFFVKKLRAMR